MAYTQVNDTFSRVPSLPIGLLCFEYISGAVKERFLDETAK